MTLDPNWKRTVDDGITNDAWDAYDDTIQTAVADYNRRFLPSASTTGYKFVDWKICKAMVWVESGGPESTDWKGRVMQIGNPGDPGLGVLMSGTEGSSLIMSPQLVTAVKTQSIDDPVLNIQAGIAYLFTRMAKFENQSVMDPRDAKEYQYAVVAGDSLDRIATKVGTTVSVLITLNPDKQKLIRPKDVLKYRKASIQLVIVGWQDFTTVNIARRYNGAGDSTYASKLDYVLGLFKNLQRKLPVIAPKSLGPSDPVTTIPLAP